MAFYLKYFFLIPFVVVMHQFYCWIISLVGEERQLHCRSLGIIYTTLGTICLFFRSLPSAMAGFFLIMLGLRLLAHSLDRLNKHKYIDRFEEEE